MNSWVRVLPAVLLAAGITVGGVALARAHDSHSTGIPAPSPAGKQVVARALAHRLADRGVSYRWVVCSPLKQRYHRARLYRCNVNFGDPHIVPYCSALVWGQLVTDHENKHLNCGARVRAEEQDQSVYYR